MQSVPKKIFFTKGVGRHKEKLQSLELALRKAGIEKCNLVRVSSIFPPNCKIVSKAQGIKLLQPGQIVFCVMSTNETNEPHRMISASVGL
ncbi:MAG: arginine decarboxylase, pyruvoyl-dependent, partial [Candidatus Scalindua sp.]|nr:arginine decarboxylase, pyruvoyl-dependent [Candidatus Scalindua sp.]